MNEEIKEMLEKPNVYSFNDECYLYFGDYNKLKDYITNLQEENQKLEARIHNSLRLLKAFGGGKIIISDVIDILEDKNEWRDKGNIR